MFICGVFSLLDRMLEQPLRASCCQSDAGARARAPGARRRRGGPYAALPRAGAGDGERVACVDIRECRRAACCVGRGERQPARCCASLQLGASSIDVSACLGRRAVPRRGAARAPAPLPAPRRACRCLLEPRRYPARAARRRRFAPDVDGQRRVRRRRAAGARESLIGAASRSNCSRPRARIGASAERRRMVLAAACDRGAGRAGAALALDRRRSGRSGASWPPMRRLRGPPRRRPGWLSMLQDVTRRARRARHEAARSQDELDAVVRPQPDRACWCYDERRPGRAHATPAFEALVGQRAGAAATRRRRCCSAAARPGRGRTARRAARPARRRSSAQATRDAWPTGGAAACVRGCVGLRQATGAAARDGGGRGPQRRGRARPGAARDRRADGHRQRRRGHLRPGARLAASRRRAPAGAARGAPPAPRRRGAAGLQAIGARRSSSPARCADYERLQRALRAGERAEVRYAVQPPRTRAALAAHARGAGGAGRRARADSSVVTLDVTEQERARQPQRAVAARADDHPRRLHRRHRLPARRPVLVRCNQRFERMLGCRPGAAAGATLEEIARLAQLERRPQVVARGCRGAARTAGPFEAELPGFEAGARPGAAQLVCAVGAPRRRRSPSRRGRWRC
ncbi:MAG: hypothetical protein MZW92_00180 [Comamonadaceae bacterium]|nr:hypothetical protein [Comamonadaceae bacterium]